MNISLSAASLVVLGLAAVAVVDDQIRTVDKPPVAGTNKHYPGNREPLAAVPLIKLPVGAVKPAGWLRKQLELQSAGFHGHLGEISEFLRKDKNAWLSPTGEGERGWEEVPYWLKGFGDCAYLLGNEEQIKEAKVWIEGAIKSQRADGYFGPRGAKSTVESTGGKYDLWPNMVMLCCLQSYYEFTGDQRVIDLMTKYFHWQLTVPDKDFLPPYWQQQRASDNLWSVLWLYNRTGDKQLLELADKIHRHTINWTDGVPDWHNVNMAEAFGGPAFYYPRSKDPRHLAAADRNFRAIRELYGQVPGGMFAGDELCRKGYADPRQAIETCGMVEEMFSDERLLMVTGDPVWADRCEDVAFNSLPAALTADFKGLRYLTSPNMIRSDKTSKAPGLCNGGNMLEMNPFLHRCCQHNFGHGWPYFTEHLWMATNDNGLAAVMYAPCTVKAKVGDGTEVTIEQVKEYPFSQSSDTLFLEFRLSLNKSARFPLYFRVPGWCRDFGVGWFSQGDLFRPIIHSTSSRQLMRGNYIVLEREWNNGDDIGIGFKTQIAIREWPTNHSSISISRGPLTYALKIGEKYVRGGGTDKWPAYEIQPSTPWNYGLVLDPANVEKSFEDVGWPNKDWPASDQPFTQEGTPLELRVKAKRIPEWKENYLGLVGLLQDSPAKSNEPVETVTLIPMGAARLRISSFPVIGEGPDAHQWVVPPEALPMKVSASHCFENDTVRAIADGLIPKNSNDHDIPRFTWWDHKGTREWVQREFDAPRKVEKVEVYWFDDAPGNGGCRTPASWRLLYRKDGQWHEVAKPSGYGVEIDKFNVTTFEPVETDALRIEVQLKEKFSGGILEWRAP